MKPVLLSADCAPEVFMVPDEVADDLRRYCLEFCEWLRESAHAAKYRHHETFDANGKRVSCCLYYDHRDFIDYLNA